MKTPITITLLFFISAIYQNVYAESPNSEIVTTIHGHVYYDENNNGTEDGTDAGIPSIDVLLTQSDGVIITAVTDANGDWSAIVIPGMTTVDIDETDADFPTNLQQSDGTDPETIMAVLDLDTDAGVDGYAGIPDITVSFNILTTLMDGITSANAIFNLYELAGVNTNGTITLILAKDNRFTFTYNNTLSTLGSQSVNNADWSYDSSNPSFHIWESIVPINALGKSNFGLEFVYDPQNTSGQVSYSITVIAGSGGEMINYNNQDVEEITFITY